MFDSNSVRIWSESGRNLDDFTLLELDGDTRAKDGVAVAFRRQAAPRGRVDNTVGEVFAAVAPGFDDEELLFLGAARR